ncbi:EcsC family protein, partial [Nocardioides hankookensis]
MGARSSITAAAGKYVAPRMPVLAPELNATFVQEALRRAIHGVGPLPPAATTAERHLREHDGKLKKAVRSAIDDHVRYAGAQGMLTSVGGAFTAMVTIPTNITGLALIQARMVAVIAHLRGYDLEDPRVRNAVLACMLGEDKADALVRATEIPAPPMALATAPVHDPEIARVLSAEVTSELVTKVAGKHAAIAVARKVPVVGGIVGMGVDGLATYQIGH